MGKEKKNLEDYLKPPDYEVRCDNFVAEVKNDIRPKYPTLGINPENETTHVSPIKPESDIQKIIDRYTFAGKSEKQIQEIKDLQMKMARINEKLSTIENIAGVDVWGWEGPEAIPKMERAIKDIFQAAEKYRGRYEPNQVNGKNMGIIDTEEPELPCAYLIFQFT